MTLIKSISGIRGTLGGYPGQGLTPPDIVKFVTAYCQLVRAAHPQGQLKIVIGRDARPSGPMVSSECLNLLMTHPINPSRESASEI